MKKYTPSHEETKSQIDLLYQNVGSYRDTKQFKELLDFCARFKTLSPYNAMLVHMQMPTAQYVLTAADWKRKHERVVLPHARPLIILVPFGPVEYAFDISETTHDPMEPKSLFEDMDFVEDIKEALGKRLGDIDEATLHTLMGNLPLYGIHCLTESGKDYKGVASLEPDGSYRLSVPLGKKGRKKFSYESHYILKVGTDNKRYVQFAAICRELGHLFCHHVPAPLNQWWKLRLLTPEEAEFEAETVAWLVCERQNVKNPSEKYLKQYLKSHAEIPNISMERILAATNEIERMLMTMNFKNGYLYKFDNRFKNKLQEAQNPDNGDGENEALVRQYLS